MPTFQFNKLVRDKFPDIYERLGQRIVSHRITGATLLKALRSELIEETAEIPLETDNREKIILELSDVEQVKKDLMSVLGITDEEIEIARQQKYKEKGGFTDGIFVETISLADNDEWVDYYRNEPEKYKELDDE